MAGVFISYRREDSAGVTGRIYDHLVRLYGRQEVFMDVDAIEPGLDFVDVLSERVSQCQTLLAVIGPNWAGRGGADGVRRIDQPEDFIQIEVAAALGRGVRVIPVLVDGAVMPAMNDLPEPLKPLARRNALQVDHARFANDMETLENVLNKLIGPAEPAAPEPAAPPADEDRFERLRAAVAPFASDQQIFVAPDLPEPRVSNAAKKCAPEPDEKIIAMIDFTAFGNGNDGLLLTDRGVHIHHFSADGPNPCHLTLDMIRDETIEKTGMWLVAIGPHRITVSGGPNRNVIVSFLHAAQEALQAG
ncbi:MAG: TIR domain-containing protein [Pseudomonadota bacterium]